MKVAILLAILFFAVHKWHLQLTMARRQKRLEQMLAEMSLEQLRFENNIMELKETQKAYGQLVQQSGLRMGLSTEEIERIVRKGKLRIMN